MIEVEALFKRISDWFLDWRPIETAPKDGTLIDLYLTCLTDPNNLFSHRCFNCWWGKRDNDWVYDPDDRMNIELVNPLKGNYAITHWRPIPKPPRRPSNARNAL
jgi:hypothetical protein